MVPATTLKAAGVDLFCGGRPLAAASEEEVLALDSRRRRCRKLVLRDGRLTGAIALGGLSEACALRELLRSGDVAPDAPLEPAPAAGPPPAPDPAATVCS